MKRYTMQPVDGHDPRTEHDGDRWISTCSCGITGPRRKSLEAALRDRFAHEESIGARIEVPELETPDP